MERYELEFVDEADKDFAKLDHATRRRVMEKLEWLARSRCVGAIGVRAE